MKAYLLFIILAFSLLSCDPFNNIIENETNKDAAIYFTASDINIENNIADTLNIVTWNIKFGGGRIDFFFDCYDDRVLMTKEEVMTNMEAVVKKITNMNPDILFLQEIDIDSKRSAYVDQLQYILDNTGFNYAYYGSQWKSDYVPSDGIGRVNSGNAILSKYELSNAERIPLSLIDEQAGIVQYFYLRRNLLKADVKIGDKTIIALNTHTSAYSTDGTKINQLNEIKTEVDLIDSEGKDFILGGDFNTIPPNSAIYENFDDDKCADGSDFESQSFKEELTTMKMFIDNYQIAIPQAKYDLDNSKYFSFTSDKDGFWNRKLDYIFTNGNFVTNTGMVHQDVSTGGFNTMVLSDHAPVSVKYVLK